MEAVIIIEPDGTTRHLVDPLSERIAAEIGPKISTQRSSHVETWRDLHIQAQEWLLAHRPLYATVASNQLYDLEEDGRDLTTHFWADLLIVGGPVLGPFEQYAEAIAAEVKYLQEANLPCPMDTIGPSSFE